MQGLYLEGGTKGVTFNTQNNEAVIEFRRMLFRNQTAIGIEAQTGSNSTGLNVIECDFSYATPGNSAVCVDAYCDYTNIERCWATVGNNGPVFVNREGTMAIRNSLASQHSQGVRRAG